MWFLPLGCPDRFLRAVITQMLPLSPMYFVALCVGGSVGVPVMPFATLAPAAEEPLEAPLWKEADRRRNHPF